MLLSLTLDFIIVDKKSSPFSGGSSNAHAMESFIKRTEQNIPTYEENVLKYRYLVN